MNWREGCPSFDYRMSMLTILTAMDMDLKDEIPGTREICHSFSTLTPKTLGFVSSICCHLLCSCFFSSKLQVYYLDFTFVEYSTPTEYFPRGVRYRALLSFGFQLLVYFSINVTYISSMLHKFLTLGLNSSYVQISTCRRVEL